MQIGSGSRVSSLVAAIVEIMNVGNDKALTAIIEKAADPRDFIEEPEKHAIVFTHLNSYLITDGYELQRYDMAVRLCRSGGSAQVIQAISDKVVTVDFDTVRRDIDRALSSVDDDPEDAVTAACSLVEGVCRSILRELNLPLPKELDIQNLYKAIREPLGIMPKKADVPAEIADDVRAILGRLNSVIQGIGALRTHAGDVHGRERGFHRIDARIARLAVHSASSAALFVIETWQKSILPARCTRLSPNMWASLNSPAMEEKARPLITPRYQGVVNVGW